MLCHVMSCHVMLYYHTEQIIRYRIISYHIISHHIIYHERHWPLQIISPYECANLHYIGDFTPLPYRILSHLVLPCLALSPAGIVWKNGRHVHQGDAAQRIEKSESSQWPSGKTDGSPDSGARGVQRDNWQVSDHLLTHLVFTSLYLNGMTWLDLISRWNH